MVDLNMVKDKLVKGGLVGVGTFTSSYIGNEVEKRAGLGGMGVAGSEIAVGAGVAVASEHFLGSNGQVRGFNVQQGAEYVGYGIQGAGWAELADTVQTGAIGGSNLVRVESQQVEPTPNQNTQNTQNQNTSADSGKVSINV